MLTLSKVAQKPASDLTRQPELPQELVKDSTPSAAVSAIHKRGETGRNPERQGLSVPETLFS